ncbi:MAG: branched-chain amino acid transaminase [Sandaracinaceae bacterium]|nr:branched-chain amino acid transaminase [Sandaracinaceae bacterium]
MVDKVEKIWMDGELIPWDEANVHILTHSLHYGLGVFEGIRCYKQHDGESAIFRLRDHIRRMVDSAHIVRLDLPYEIDQLVEASAEVVRANQLDECYIRPIAFLGAGAMGVGARPPTRVGVIAWRWGTYLGDDALSRGIRAKISSFARVGVNSLMTKAKVTGHYVNSILANREAHQAGYDEAILLDPQGFVTEGSGENLFLIRDGVLYSPSLGGSILSGITRHTVTRIAKELGLPLVERPISRDELYIADELFMVGTAAEVTPISEVDDRRIGSGVRGEITEKIQSTYFDVVRGKLVLDEEWLHRI